MNIISRVDLDAFDATLNALAQVDPGHQVRPPREGQCTNHISRRASTLSSMRPIHWLICAQVKEGRIRSLEEIFLHSM